jgi:hypothetical protein
MKNVQFWTSAMEKQVAFRVNTILNDPHLLAIHQAFGQDIFRRSSAMHGLDEFLRANEVRGDTCFEIGTWAGITAVILSRYFKRVVTIDIVDHPLKRDILAHLGITNVECVKINSNNDKPKIVKELGAGFDFAYLDGDHHADAEADYALTKHCGRTLFQEVFPWQSPVWEQVEKLPKDQVTRGGFGFALWQAPKG